MPSSTFIARRFLAFAAKVDSLHATIASAPDGLVRPLCAPARRKVMRRAHMNSTVGDVPPNIKIANYYYVSF
jgi:hypothetical protein